MPNRVIREGILDSEKINMLTWPAEVFYRRLMSLADDFGRYDGRVKILRTKLYGLKIDKVTEADVEKWMLETAEAGLVSRYTVDGKPYLEIWNFSQAVRIKKSKWPAPFDSENTQMKSHATHLQADDFTRMSESNPIQTETNPKANPIQLHTPAFKNYDLEYYKSIGYEWKMQQKVSDSLDVFLKYRRSSSKHGPVESPLQVEAILKEILVQRITPENFEKMVNRTISKGAKNMIWELENAVSIAVAPRKFLNEQKQN